MRVSIQHADTTLFEGPYRAHPPWFCSAAGHLSDVCHGSHARRPDAQYAAFLAASGYRPQVGERFLAHWHAAGRQPGRKIIRGVCGPGRMRAPMPAGRQTAATGRRMAVRRRRTDGRRYPWGERWWRAPAMMQPRRHDAGLRAYPRPLRPSAVTTCAATSAVDGERAQRRHTRVSAFVAARVLIRPRVRLVPDGGPVACHFAAKFLLLWPGLDRCATIGFRWRAGPGVAGARRTTASAAKKRWLVSDDQ